MQRRVFAIIAGWFIAVVVLAPVTQAASSITSKYVAMGDSVAAGAGLNSSGVCDRSSQAYPTRVAARLRTSVINVACSGAKVDEGIYGEQYRGGMEITSQIDQAFVGGTPTVITMTIGANDVRWIQFLQKCQVGTCGTRFDNTAAKVLRGDLRVELYWALHKINSMSNGHPPRVLLNGYYNALGNNVCAGMEQITATERSWLRARTADLNQAIRSVTPWFSNAKFVPISFTGHEACSSSPWVQGVDDPAPFHPTVAGQDVIANANLRALGL